MLLAFLLTPVPCVRFMLAVHLHARYKVSEPYNSFHVYIGRSGLTAYSIKRWKIVWCNLEGVFLVAKMKAMVKKCFTRWKGLSLLNSPDESKGEKEHGRR